MKIDNGWESLQNTFVKVKYCSVESLFPMTIKWLHITPVVHARNKQWFFTSIGFLSSECFVRIGEVIIEMVSDGGEGVQAYLALCERILTEGSKKEDRTGTGTISIFGHQMRFDLQEGFPLLTTKKLHLRSIIYELLWFLRGDTNIKYLQDHGVSIWNEWADENGDLGPVYGKQWRSFEGANQQTVDQITWLIDEIKRKPDSRRLIVSAWNPVEIEGMALPPCHCLFQFYISDGKLSCQLYQRSADVFLGVPFNIASYALLTHLIAQVTGYAPGDFVHTFGDAHIYLNHLDQIKEQLSRQPYSLPQLQLNSTVTSIFDFQYDDIEIINYQAHPHIKGSVSV